MTSDKKRISLPSIAGASLALVALCVAYFPLWSNGFNIFDDDIYITANEFVQRGLRPDTLQWAFSFADKPGTYWHPLTWLSLMLDHTLFGLNPAGYHGMNLLLHACNAGLVFLLLRRCTRETWAAAVTAALFLLHPVNVESVAWIVERKTVLCLFFGLLALLAYIRYTRHPSLGRYLPVCGLFLLGLMSKPMLVTLPLLLLLLDFWPLARLPLMSPHDEKDASRPPLRSVLLEKVPLVLMSCASAAMTVLSLLGRSVNPPAPEFGIRLENAVISYATYLKTLLWPTGLAAFYPPRMTHYPHWQTATAALVVIALAVVAVKTVRTRPWWLVGCCWYAGSLFTASGLFRSGLWPERADRFIYLPSIGLFLILACEAALLLQRRPSARVPLAVGGAAVLIAMTMATQKQVRVWHDGETLFEHAVQVTERNLHAHHILGRLYFFRGEQIKAFNHFAAEKALDPANPDYDIYLGYLSFLNGDHGMAREKYTRVLATIPDHLDALYLMGMLCEKEGDAVQARVYYTKGLASRSVDLYSMRALFKERLRELAATH